jgi:hypothetical protein
LSEAAQGQEGTVFIRDSAGKKAHVRRVASPHDTYVGTERGYSLYLNASTGRYYAVRVDMRGIQEYIDNANASVL